MILALIQRQKGIVLNVVHLLRTMRLGQAALPVISFLLGFHDLAPFDSNKLWPPPKRIRVLVLNVVHVQIKVLYKPLFLRCLLSLLSTHMYTHIQYVIMLANVTHMSSNKRGCLNFAKVKIFDVLIQVINITSFCLPTAWTGLQYAAVYKTHS